MKLTINDLQYIICEAKRLLSEITIKEAYSKYYFSLGEKFYTEILSRIQPEQKNVLLPITKWVLGVALKNPENVRENLDKLCNDEGNGILQIYQRLVTLDVLDEREKNIMNFKTIEAVEEITSRFNPDDLWGNNNDRKKRVLRSNFIVAKDDVDLIYEDNTWLIISPKSYEAAVYWGHGTSWCTSYKDNDSFYKEYTASGPLYININIKTGEKFQFHFPTNSFRNKWDGDIDYDDNGKLQDNLIKCIGGNNNMLKAYKQVLSNDEYECLLKKKRIIYDNPSFQVITQRRVPINHIHNFSFADDSIFPLNIITKENNKPIVDWLEYEGFCNFYPINEQTYMITIQSLGDGDLPTAVVKIITLQDILKGEIGDSTGETYDLMEDETETLLKKYPNVKDFITKINDFIKTAY